MSSSDDSQRDTVTTAQKLTGALNRMSGQLQEVNRYGRRSRRMILGLAASLALDVVLTGVIWVVAVQAGQANDRADRLHAAQVANCEIGNQSRHGNQQLWNYILRVAHPKTAQERQRLVQFRAQVRAVFAARDCSHV